MAAKKRSKPKAVWLVIDHSNLSLIFAYKTKAAAIEFVTWCGADWTIIKYVPAETAKRNGNAVNEVKNWDKKKRDTLSAIYEARQKAQRNDD